MNPAYRIKSIKRRRQYMPLTLRVKVFFLLYGIGIQFSGGVACVSSTPHHKARPLRVTDIKRCLIDLLIKFEVRQFDRPLSHERAVDGVDRQLDGVNVR